MQGKTFDLLSENGFTRGLEGKAFVMIKFYTSLSASQQGTEEFRDCLFIDAVTGMKIDVRRRDAWTPDRAICLGKGRISQSGTQSVISIAQLHVFREMLYGFDIEPSQCFFYDPAFEHADKVFLLSLGYQVSSDPEEAHERQICCRPTVVFAPHLPFHALEDLFRQNWSKDLLHNIFLFGDKLNGWLKEP